MRAVVILTISSEPSKIQTYSRNILASHKEVVDVPSEYRSQMAIFLLKTEPSEYSFDDLVREKSTRWSGISSPAGLKALREMAKGDEAFIYHTADEKRIVGMATVTRAAYPDPGAEDGRLVAVDLKAGPRVKMPVMLAQVKADARFKDFALVKQSRLSAMPVPPALAAILKKLTGLA